MFNKKFVSILLPITLFTSFSVYSENNKKILSVGYAYVHVKSAPALNGINLRAQSQPNSKNFSLLISTTLAQKSFYNDQRLRYASLSMGFSYEFTPYIELYGTLGVSGLGYKVKNNNNINDNAGSVSWGTGITFSPYKPISFTVGYEGSYFKIAEQHIPTNTLIASLGYRF
ncbi:outer membrane beta-barrel protein [Acinetobacter baumannii]|uniref:outer membrane beta-barrel protein n=1 Tax=Acinetobacter baumannii TaxID=470 RepID=UPI0034D02109